MSPSINGANGVAVGRGGDSRRPAGGSARATMLHIKDITTATPNVDPHQPIRKLIETGDVHMRQAETCLNFKRPDLALKEYIQGYIITVDIIPHHKEFPTIRNDRGGLGRLYQTLKHKVQSEVSKYDEIKLEIIADNARNNTQPANAVSSQRSAEDAFTGSPAKTKPSIQPKPQALHGNSIRPGSSKGHASTNSTDLNARFANLRGPMAAQQQDPRIKTQPIPPMAPPMGPPPPPPPRGPRQMPTKPRASVSVDSTVPNLPKVPDAIYSPARGTVSTEAGQLPSSTPRGLFSRTNSTNSFAPAATDTVAAMGTAIVAKLQAHSNNSAYPTDSPSNNPASSSAASLALPMPTGDELSARELYDLMKWRGGQILIIDVRPRESFSEGHILSQATICIEPAVLLRENISAAEIAESNVVGPAEEQTHFDRRDEFEAVVLYDQSSEYIPERPTTDEGRALMALRRALVDFNYERKLRHSPKLLKGGLDAWTDLMGTQSLESSSLPRHRPAAPQAAESPITAAGRGRARIVSKPVGPEDAERWQKSIQRGDRELAESPTLTRSTEEFLRRYPPVFPTQESMTSPVTPMNQPNAFSATELPIPGERYPPVYNDLPSPPTRPAPAVPRPSYSGLGHGEEGMAVSPVVKPSHSGRAQIAKRAIASDVRRFTGLYNKQNWCYANSLLQALRVTPGFGDDLAGIKESKTWNVPRRKGERLDQPQLMAKILGNLFQWMKIGNFPDMKAETLMDYSRHVARNRDSDFGGDDQQDAAEYLEFLFRHLELETNRVRDREPPKGMSAPPGGNGKLTTAFEAAVAEWRICRLTSDSLIDKYFRGVEVKTTECQCGHKAFKPQCTAAYNMAFGEGCRTLGDVVRHHTAKTPQLDYTCDNCSKVGLTKLSDRFAKLPPVFIVVLGRGNNAGVRKGLQVITFDLNDMDFEPLFLEPRDRIPRWGEAARQAQLDIGEELDDGWFGPQFRYQCYGVVVHDGQYLTSGHYYSYVRSDMCGGVEKWYKCDDRIVTELKPSAVREELFGSKKREFATPYILFFRRKPVGSEAGPLTR